MHMHMANGRAVPLFIVPLDFGIYVIFKVISAKLVELINLHLLKSNNLNRMVN